MGFGAQMGFEGGFQVKWVIRLLSGFRMRWMGTD